MVAVALVGALIMVTDAAVAEVTVAVATAGQIESCLKKEWDVAPATTVERWATEPESASPRPRRGRPISLWMKSHRCCYWRWDRFKPRFKISPLL
jgi:hypothetical protein